MSAANRAPWRALALWIALLVPDAAGAGEIVAAGAVSLRGTLTEIAQGFERRRPDTRVQLTFGASSFLAAQLRAGAAIDVFVSADARIVEALVTDGLVRADAHGRLATNRLVVMVRPDLSPLPRTAAELDAPVLRRIAMPDFAVPVGRYAREWLTRRGMLEQLGPRIVSTEHARATLAAVDAGHADAAIVYATDARLARSARLAFEVPDDEQPKIVYAVSRSREAAPGSEAFFAWILGPEAREILRRAGFGAP